MVLMKESINYSSKKDLGAILMIAGTSIGGGMIAFPQCLASLGVFSSLCLLCSVWIFFLISAQLFVTLSITFPGKNFLSITQEYLGKKGGWFCSFVYFILLVSLLCAYMDALRSRLLMGLIFAGLTWALHKKNQWATYRTLPFLSFVVVLVLLFAIPFAVPAPHHSKLLWWCQLPTWSPSQSPLLPTVSQPIQYICLGCSVGLVLYQKLETIQQWNTWCSWGMALCFFPLVVLLVFLCVTETPPPHVTSFSIRGWWSALPIIVTAFGFHVVIPSLVKQLGYDQARSCRAIYWGSAIPLVVYLVWSTLVLLSAELYEERFSGNSIAQSLSYLFSFFAICTSLFGVAVSLLDFVKDAFPRTNFGMRGLHWMHPTHKAFHLILTFFTSCFPTLLLILYPNSFLIALKYAGVCAAFLLGVVPAVCILLQQSRFQQEGSGITPKRLSGRLSAGTALIFFTTACVLSFLQTL